MSDPFIKNENSVLSILIEKNFEHKIYFCPLKTSSIFYNEGKFPKSFSQLHVKIRDFSFHTVGKKTIGPRHTPAQGYRLSPTSHQINESKKL